VLTSDVYGLVIEVLCVDASVVEAEVADAVSLEANPVGDNDS
jgi:hypothetical protein